ncbi:MAG TPA: N(4)-(beta-N-acetylglucosaminyl)-L-asparaginase [Humisphaera sp.]
MPMQPVLITTWPFGGPANEAAWPILAAGGPALDATIAGATYCEADETVDNVGFGGLPDASGRVSLDACVMDHRGRCGGVACVRRVLHVAQVARRVMERTKHVLLVGPDADRFAIEQGFPEQDLLSPAAAARYQEWLAANPKPPPGGHDTITLLGLDRAGHLAGTCSTSGTAWKLPGRVGDSPIVGAGLYVDGKVGAAGATGVGEELVRVCGSFAVVENMRRGMEPVDAIRDVLKRIVDRRGDAETDVSLIALRSDGAYAGMSIRRQTRFFYALRRESGGEVIEAPVLID